MQKGGKEKKMGFEIPLFAVWRSPAAMHSVFHPRGAAANLGITSREEGQNETEMINFYWHITSCYASDNKQVPKSLF